MVMLEDAIVDIPENRLRYFGGPGKMLLPSPATIAALIEKIPENKLVTLVTLLRWEPKELLRGINCVFVESVRQALKTALL